MATEAADLRVKVSASGTAETTAELMAVDKAIDMVGDDSRDSNVGVGVLSSGLSELSAEAIDVAGNADEAGTAVGGMGSSMGEAGIKADVLSVALKGGLVVALGALLAPLISIGTTLGTIVAGLVTATPAFIALGGAFFYIGQQALLTATHTDNLADAWAKLTKEGEPLGEALDKLKEAAKPMADEFLRFVEDIGPKAIRVFADIVRAVEDNFEPVLDAAQTQIGNFLDFVRRTSEKVAPMMDNIITRVGKMFEDIAVAFEPAIKPSILAALDIFEGLSDGIRLWLKPMIPFIRPVGKALGDFLRELGRQLGRVAEALAPSMPAFFRILRSVLKSLGDILVEIAPDIVEFVKAFADMVKDPKAKKQFADMLQIVLDILTLLADIMPTVIDLFQPFVDGFKNMMEGLKEGSAKGLLELGAFLLAFPAWINAKLLVGAKNLLVDKGRALIDGLKNGIIRAWNAVVAWLGRVGEAVIRFFNGAKSWLLDKGRQLIDGFKNGIIRAWNAVLNFFQQLPGRIVGAVGDLGSRLLAAGQAVIQGLWDGMQERATSMLNWVGDLAGKIASLKGPIEKDRMLLQPQGKAIMEGLGKGMSDGWKKVEQELRNVAPNITSTVGVMGADARGQAVGAGRIAGTLRITNWEQGMAFIDARVDAGVHRQAQFEKRRTRMNRR